MTMDMIAKSDLRPARRRPARPALRPGARLGLLSAASIAFALGLWFALAASGLLPKMLLPSPWDVAQALVRNIGVPFAGATLQQHLLASLGRFFSGFALAVVVGVPVGLLMGWFAPFRHAIAPFFETFRFIAPLAWVPFAALWFGTGIGGPILIVFSGAFAACVINTYRGARMTDERLIEACRTLGAGNWRLIVDVLLPSALPSIMAGIRVAAALGWQSLIGAELIVASSGVGYLIVQGQGSVETPIVMAGMATIGFVGLAIDLGLRQIDARIGRAWRMGA
jgi:NitT/TauT family transport system permease protein